MNIQFKKSKVARAASGFVGFAMAMSLVLGGAVAPVQAQSITDLTAQINSLLSTIAALQAQLNSMQGGSTPSTGTGYVFNTNLTVGAKSTDVMNLQKVLNMSADTRVSTSGAGSAGNETSTFGPATKAAVVKFQLKYGISPAVGYVGPVTRAKLNSMGGSVVTNPPIVGVAGALTVSPAAQPTATLVPQNAARVPFTRITLTAGGNDVTVNSITVERTGLADDAAFDGVVLLDQNGMQLGVAKTLNSNGQAAIGESFVIPAGTSKIMTVAANMETSLTSYNGQVASFTVVGVNTSATVVGSLPITGASHTINSTLAIGAITNARGPLDPNGPQSKPVGTTGYTFSAIKVTAGSAEQVRLHSIRWNQSGSASANDLTNVKVIVDGTSYDTVVSADGKYYTASFGSGILVDKGLSKEISIKGDIISGTNRTVAFDLYRTTDLNVSGELFGYGIVPPTSGTGFASTNPWYDASVVTVTAGTANTISKSNTVAAQNIAVLASNQPLAAFEVEIKGEPITVGQFVFNILASGDEAENITNISLVNQNGAVIAGPVDGVSTASNSAHGTVTFTDNVTFPVGKTILTMRGQLGSAFVSGDTVQASTTPSSQWTEVQGANTGDTVSLAGFSSVITANLMTVRAGALSISVSSQPTARTIIAGAQGFEFARYIFDAGQSGEDVKLSSFPALLALTTITASQLGNCNLSDGATNVTNETNLTLAAGDNTFTFNSGGVTVPKGTQKTLSMKCDVSTGATSGTAKWGLTNNAVTFTGATSIGSGQTVTETMTASAGQTMTAATSGSYTVTNDTSLLYKTAQAGTTGVVLANLRFTAGGSEAIDLKQIALELGNTASNSPADLVGLKVNLYNGSSLIGTAQFGAASPDNATSTLLSPAPRIAAGESLLITVKGDLSAQNINEGTPGAFLAITYDGGNVGTDGNYARGADSQTDISSGTTSDVTTNGLRIFRTVPTIAVTSTGGSLAPGADLYTFTVNNPNSRDVVFQKFTFSVATTGGAVTGFTLYGDGVAANAVADEAAGATGSQVVESIIDATSQAKIVPPNSSKIYTLRAATVVDTASVAETINIALVADTSYPSCASLMCTVTEVEAGSAATDNIVWSPFSTTTPIATSATEGNQDWTNGYGLPGFPANADFPVQTWTRAN